MVDEVLHFENVEVVQVNVLRVASTKSNNFVFLDGACSMKSFMKEAFNTFDCWFVPFLRL